MRKILIFPTLILMLIVLMITESIWFHGQVVRKKWKYIPLFFVWIGGVWCFVMVIAEIISNF